MERDRIGSLFGAPPQWSAVAIAPEEQPVEALLTWNGGTRDVTNHHSVASLMPLTIAIDAAVGETATLDYRENGRSLGTLHMTKQQSISAADSQITLYQVTGGSHRCLPWLWRTWQRWLQGRRTRLNRAKHNFTMDPAALQQLMICYIRPRPVVLVSVSAPGHFNIFPMDLIGSFGTQITLALRSTNISIPIMRTERRVVLSCLPAEMKSIAYELGEHHCLLPSDLTALPFPTRSSQTLKIASVANALRIRELRIRHAEEVGSHTLFIADILSDELINQGLQLHHVPGFYQSYRHRYGMAFPLA